MKTIINNIAKVAILVLVAVNVMTLSAQTLTVTMKNGTVYTYDVSSTSTEVDSVRYVGGDFGTTTGEGVKIYPHGTTVSIDLLYSQMESLTLTGGVTSVSTPVISPNGGTITSATTVTITCSTSGATIYYTTNGTTPSSSNFAGTGSSGLTVSVSATCTLQAMAVLNGVSSGVASATFTYSSSGSDNNVNANWHSSNWTVNNGSMSYTPKSAGFWRLEVPHISDDNTTSWVQKSTTAYGVTFALEWDNSKKANRWTCYQMHAGNNAQNVSRNDAFKADTELPSSTRSTTSDYSGSGFSRGHLCPSSDRLCSSEQNSQTFYMSNMQPQYSNHNSGQWNTIEQKLRSWANLCDTLYIVKAATIDDVTLNGSTSSGLLSVQCNNRLPVPKYFYMAFLAYNKSTDTYKAMGIWTYHYNSTSERQSAEYITIDELEQRTGIDFFCNLPDDIETAVEATLDTSYWSSGASLDD